MNLENLKNEIPYKWRIQSCFENNCTLVAYIDARQLFDCLDVVCGPENWQSEFKEIQGRLYGGIGIKIKGEWIWKWDTGTESQIEKEKGQASDALKRAGVHWGIGRFLYDLEVQKIWKTVNDKRGKPQPADENGKRIYDINKYIQDRQAQKTPPKKEPEKKTPAQSVKDKKETDATPKLSDTQRKVLFGAVNNIMKALFDYDPADAPDFIHHYFKVISVNDITPGLLDRFIKNCNKDTVIQDMHDSWGVYRMQQHEKSQEQGA